MDEEDTKTVLTYLNRLEVKAVKLIMGTSPEGQQEAIEMLEKIREAKPRELPLRRRATDLDRLD